MPSPSCDPATHAALNDFFGLTPSSRLDQWHLPVSANLLNFRDVMHGGCALAAATLAAEQWTERPTITAAAQFTALGKPGAEVAVRLSGHNGRLVSQVNATLVDVGTGTQLMCAKVTLGGRSVGQEYSNHSPPEVPIPAECAARRYPADAVRSFSTISE